jgi:hypothetical protein
MNGINGINSISNNDIDLFISTYERELNNGTVPHPKIGLWIQYLKALKFYNVNNIEKDQFFDKRHSITKNDINEINNFMNRIKKGKKLYKNDHYNITGTSNSNNSFINYNFVDENDEDEDNNNNKNHFELLSQVEGALYEYNEKMKKNKNKNLYGNRASNASYSPNACYNPNASHSPNASYNPNASHSPNASYNPNASHSPNSRYNPNASHSSNSRYNPNAPHSPNEHKSRVNPMNICPDNYKYGVQDFAEDSVDNTNLSNAINQLENTEKLINYNYTNRFDNEFKRSIPNIANNKNHQLHNSQYKLVNDNIVNDKYGNDNFRPMNSTVGVDNGGRGGGPAIINDRYNQDALYTNNYRFNQDQDILKLNLITRDPSQKNKQPFENQFQYLDCNYNRIPNKSLIGESSRMDNRTYMH